MARRKMFRRAARSTYKTARRGFKRAGSSETLMGGVLPAAIYGVARAPLAKLAVPVSSKLPLGGYEDEAVLALAGYALHKWTPKGGLLSKVGKVAVIVETASVVSQMTSGMTGGSTVSSSNLYG